MSDFRTTMMSQRNALLKKRQQDGTSGGSSSKTPPPDMTLASHRMHMSPALQTIKKLAMANKDMAPSSTSMN